VIIYLATREEFLQQVLEQRIEEVVRQCYVERTGHKVAANEFRAWQNSLQCVGNVLQFEAIPKELGVAIEYKIHNTAKRIDLLLSGRNSSGAPAAVIVELKQWETVEATDLDGVVRTFLGKGQRETTHPSYQAMSYGVLLRGVNTAVVEHGIALQPCAYLHNCVNGSGLTDARYTPYLEQAPVFLRHDNAAMATFLRRCLEVGDRGRTIEQIRDGKAKPSQQLADAVERMLKGNTEFVLIDEQKVVFEQALALARRIREGRHTVLLVQGGPGTGKSVVAVNLLARLLGMGLNARYVSKNAAPRAMYRAKLTGSLQKGEYDNLFCGSACFVGCPEGFYDALIVDESHRLMTKTIYDKEGENQIKEIIHASKLAVFFLDEDQRVTFDDIGSTAEIEKWSQFHEAELQRAELPSQFRCSGSDGYLAWLDATLGIRSTANERLDPGSYDFRVFDDPVALHGAIRQANHSN
jgi:ATP:corrinoid adenosyltransferase